MIVLEMKVSGADDAKLIMKIIKIQKDTRMKVTLETKKSYSQGQSKLVKEAGKSHPGPDEIQVEDRAKKEPSSV